MSRQSTSRLRAVRGTGDTSPDTREAVVRLIAEARGLADLPAGAAWEDPVWDVTHWGKDRRSLVSLRYNTEGGKAGRRGTDFVPVFADVVKAHLTIECRLNRREARTVQARMPAIRALYLAVSAPDGSLPGSFAWDQLTLRDWHRAEGILVASRAESGRYGAATGLQAFATFLERRGVIPHLGYRHQQRAGRSSTLQHVDDRGATLEKLPDPRALAALAVAAQHPRDPRDRLLFAIITLLVSLGFRISEVLTLPVGCWQVRDGRPCILYWPRKRGPLVPKWIPTHAVELVRGAVDTISEITEPTRQRALVLEGDPARVPLLVSHPPDAELTAEQLAPALGVTGPGGTRSFLSGHAIPPHATNGGRRGTQYRWRAGDVEHALAARLPEHRHAFVTPDGREQPLSRFLCVVASNFFRGRTELLLIEPIAYGPIKTFLGGTRYKDSVFARYGLFDPEGHPWVITSHQFRHWINTLAHKGGLSEIDLARWMGRRDLRTNADYQHLTQEERLARVKGALRDGTVRGPIGEIYRRLAEGGREAFLDAAVEAVHLTPYGVCVRNFAVRPCEYHVRCLHGCGSFLRTVGSEREIIAITSIQRRSTLTLAAAERESARPDALPEAANWVDASRRLLVGCERALAVDGMPGTRAGEHVPVFPGAPSLSDADTPDGHGGRRERDDQGATARGDARSGTRRASWPVGGGTARRPTYRE